MLPAPDSNPASSSENKDADLGRCLTADGLYLYTTNSVGRGVSKLGSGLHGTLRGFVYCRNEELEPGWVAFGSGSLLHRPVSFDNKPHSLFQVIDQNTLQVCQVVPMPANHLPVGSTMSTVHLSSDGTYFYWIWSPASLNEKTPKGHSVFMDIFELGIENGVFVATALQERTILMRKEGESAKSINEMLLSRLSRYRASPSATLAALTGSTISNTLKEDQAANTSCGLPLKMLRKTPIYTCGTYLVMLVPPPGGSGSSATRSLFGGTSGLSSLKILASSLVYSISDGQFTSRADLIDAPGSSLGRGALVPGLGACYDTVNNMLWTCSNDYIDQWCNPGNQAFHYVCQRLGVSHIITEPKEEAITTNEVINQLLHHVGAMCIHQLSLLATNPNLPITSVLGKQHPIEAHHLSSICDIMEKAMVNGDTCIIRCILVVFQVVFKFFFSPQTERNRDIVRRSGLLLWQLLMAPKDQICLEIQKEVCLAISSGLNILYPGEMEINNLLKLVLTEGERNSGLAQLRDVILTNLAEQLQNNRFGSDEDDHYRLNDELLHYILKIVVRESCILITKCQTVSKDGFQKLLSTVPAASACLRYLMAVQNHLLSNTILIKPDENDDSDNSLQGETLKVQELKASILALATQILTGCDEVLEMLQQVTTALINSDLTDCEQRLKGLEQVTKATMLGHLLPVLLTSLMHPNLQTLTMADALMPQLVQLVLYTSQTALLLKTQSPVFADVGCSPRGAPDQKGRLFPDERMLEEKEEPGFLTGLKIPAPWAAGKTVETVHPVRDNYKFKETVHIPGARCLYLRFDSRCSSQYDYDKLVIYAGPNTNSRKVAEYGGNTLGYGSRSVLGTGWPKDLVKVEGDTVTFSFEMRSGREHNTPDKAMWGFACTVRAQESSEDVSGGLPFLVDLALGLSVLACSMLRILYNGPEITKEEEACQELLRSKLLQRCQWQVEANGVISPALTPSPSPLPLTIEEDREFTYPADVLGPPVGNYFDLPRIRLPPGIMIKLREISGRARPQFRPSIKEVVQPDVMEEMVVSCVIKHLNLVDALQSLINFQYQEEHAEEYDLLCKIMGETFKKLNAMERQLQSVAELEQKWQSEVEEATQGKLENSLVFFYDYHFNENKMKELELLCSMKEVSFDGNDLENMVLSLREKFIQEVNSLSQKPSHPLAKTKTLVKSLMNRAELLLHVTIAAQSGLTRSRSGTPADTPACKSASETKVISHAVRQPVFLRSMSAPSDLEMIGNEDLEFTRANQRRRHVTSHRSSSFTLLQSLAIEDSRDKPTYSVLLGQLFAFIGTNPDQAVSSSSFLLIEELTCGGMVEQVQEAFGETMTSVVSLCARYPIACANSIGLLCTIPYTRAPQKDLERGLLLWLRRHRLGGGPTEAVHSGLARQVSSLLTNHLARATECCGNQAAGNDALQDVLSLLNDLSSSSEGRPFRLGTGANMEKVVKMDRDMTKGGCCEVITEEAVAALRKATKWAQSGLIVSVGPPVESVNPETVSGLSTGDKKKTAQTSICRERNSELARTDPVRPFISGHVANSMAAEVIALLHSLLMAPESNAAQIWTTTAEKVLSRALMYIPQLGKYAESILENGSSSGRKLAKLQRIARQAVAALCALGGFKETIKIGSEVQVLGRGVSGSIGAVASVNEQEGIATVRFPPMGCRKTSQAADTLTIPLSRLCVPRSEALPLHKLSITEKVVQAVQSMLLPQEGSLSIHTSLPATGDGSAPVMAVVRLLAEIRTRACLVMAQLLEDSLFCEEFIQQCPAAVEVLNLAAQECSAGERLAVVEVQCERLRMLYRDCARPPPPPLQADRRQPREITWSPSRVFPPVRACMFSSHLTSVTFLADPSAGGGLPRGTFIYATSPLPVQAPSFYWEIEIVSYGDTDDDTGPIVSFGFATEAEKRDGAWTNPVGTCLFHNNGRAVHYNGSSLLQWKSVRLDVTLCPGDVAGIGWERTEGTPPPPGQPAKGRVYFTYCGQRLAPYLEDVSGGMWPVVHIQKKNTKTRANFGSRPFAYAEGQAHRNAADLCTDLAEEISANFEALPFAMASDSDNDAGTSIASDPGTHGPPCRIAAVATAQQQYDSDTSCRCKVELSYENFITSGPDPHPPPIADDESDDDDDDDIPQEDHYALLVKAWETKVFPTIRRRFRNEAERKSGLDQIKGALQLGMVDIARQTVEFLYEENGGIPRDLYLPTIEDIKDEANKFTIDKVRKGLTVVTRSPDSNNVASNAVGTALPKFAIRGMLKTFGLHGVVLDVDSVNELVQVETYLRSEGVLVRYWYPLDRLERPPAGYRRTATNGLVTLDNTSLQIHRELLRCEAALARLYCRMALLNIFAPKLPHLFTRLFHIPAIRDITLEHLQLLSNQLLAPPLPDGTLSSSSILLAQSLQHCSHGQNCSATDLFYQGSAQTVREWLNVAITRTLHQGEESLLELTKQLCSFLQTAPEQFPSEEFPISESKVNMDVNFPGAAFVVVSCKESQSGFRKDSSLYKAPWARVLVYGLGHKVKRSGQLSLIEAVCYPRDASPANTGLTPPPTTNQYPSVILSTDKVHIKLGVSPTPGAVLMLHSLPLEFPLAMAFAEQLLSWRSEDSEGKSEDEPDTIPTSVLLQVVELLGSFLWTTDMAACVKEQVFHLLAELLRTVHALEQRRHPAGLSTSIALQLNPCLAMLMALQSELHKLYDEEAQSWVSGGPCGSSGAAVAAEQGRFSTYFHALMEGCLAVAEVTLPTNMSVTASGVTSTTGPNLSDSSSPLWGSHMLLAGGCFPQVSGAGGSPRAVQAPRDSKFQMTSFSLFTQIRSRAKIEKIRASLFNNNDLIGLSSLDGEDELMEMSTEEILTVSVVNQSLFDTQGSPGLEDYFNDKSIKGEKLVPGAREVLTEIFKSCAHSEQMLSLTPAKPIKVSDIYLSKEQINSQTPGNLLHVFFTNVRPPKKVLEDQLTQILRKYGVPKPKSDKSKYGKAGKEQHPVKVVSTKRPISKPPAKDKAVLNSVSRTALSEKKPTVKPKSPEKNKPDEKDPEKSPTKKQEVPEEKYLTLDGFHKFVIDRAKQDIRSVWRAILSCGYDLHFERCACIDVRHAQKASRKWTLEMDVALVQYINRLCRHLAITPARLHPHEVYLDPADSTDPRVACLLNVPIESLRLRFALLQSLNTTLETFFLPLVELRQTPVLTHSIAALLKEAKGLIFYDTKVTVMNRVLNATVQRTADHAAPEITLDPLEIVGGEIRASENSYFCQAARQLASVPSSQLCVQLASGGDPTYSFNMRFTGEEVHGTSGSFRHFLWQVCKELQSSMLSLLLLCPSSAVSKNKGKYILTPGPISYGEEQLLHFLGQLLGIAIRADVPLPLDLLPSFWKTLVGEPLDPDLDLKEADILTYNYVKKFESINDETELEALCAEIASQHLASESPDGPNRPCCRFTYLTMTGEEVELCSRGRHIPVAWENKDIYSAAIRSLRLRELQNVECVTAVRAGLGTIIPLQLLTTLSPREMELRTCGLPYINLEFLKAHTMYQVGLMETDQHIEFFWGALEMFSQEELCKFIKFACNQERIPFTCPCKDGGPDTAHVPPYPMKIAPPDGTAGSPDSRYIRVETCMFMIKLPQYSSLDIMLEKLRCAIHYREDPLSG
ncbi:probable E3 ubiquitin-protein ligase HECTD4 [Echinops telfairi]|uniref:Probable E3 ubiquitin-protein ligase HECTD4 n=1 Tax=Echinops telfairi TaxID=9371 RepID=A0AC55DLK4_ECHTE|nr:probable E3 ubiquitin-protein ligase HECTD4 [Echinops telfairi]